MLVLALDTSTYQSSLALCSDGQVYGEYTWYSNNNHSVELLSSVQRLLAECHYTLSQLDAVAVATGPGSFNGVRVAMATAKSFAFALKKPLVGISTLDIFAFQHYLWPGPVCALQEAGRGDLYAACYRFEAQDAGDGVIAPTMQQFGDYIMLPPQQLAVHIQKQAEDWFGIPGERQLPQMLFCGEMTEASRQQLRSQLGELCLFAHPVSSTRHAATLAMLATQRLQSGNVDDPLSLEPLYLRRPSITTSTRKRPLLGETAEHSTGHTTTEREEGALRH